MRNIYTFVSYLLFSFFIQKTICLDLNIGNIRDYSSGSTDVTVKKITEIQNLYTHEFSGPLSLKDIYNGDKKIYFDPLLVKDQLLLSASVIWLFRKPSVIQLNLEKSSVLLLNEENSTLDVQAIFSEKLVTNLSPRIHPNNDKVVDVNLSKTIDYDIDNSKVYVTNLEFSEDRFKRYTLRNYNLDSTKLGKILYNGTELKTKTENDSERATESNLVIPYKDNIYSILVYAYNDFPLLIEVLYTFNKRQFYGYTDDKKWHQVLFPAYHDPSFSDFLYNKLNYYACKNGFKYTIDIKKKTASADNSYQIDNYCIGSEGVETVPNDLTLASYNDEKKASTHKCFEHTPSNNNKFFIDHLMVDTSLLKLPNMPNIIKCARVYYQSNAKPQLIVLVDNSDVLHYYINRNEVWNEFKKEENVKFDERFNDSIRASLDNVAPTVQVDEGSIVVLTDRKTSYNKEQITNDLKNNLSSDFFDNEITVKENTEDKGSCLAGAGYKVYMHDLSSAASIFSHSSGSNVQFLFYVNNTKIDLYESTKVNSNPLSLAYDKQNSLYVYFYREYPKALSVCYNGKLYRPYNSEEYTKKWVHVKQVNDCCCKSGSNQRNNKALSDALFNVIQSFNLVNPYEQTLENYEYEYSSLFFEYTHLRPKSQQAHNIQVCKKLDCSKILNLTNGTEYSERPLDRALVYFNKFDTSHEKPLMISLHFRNSGETRYYAPSEVHDSSDSDSSKPLTGLTKYTNDPDFVNTLLEKNDTLHNSVTYQIDKKDSSYNAKRVNVTKEGDTVSKLNSNGFAKYVHSPTSDNTEKKSFILHRSNTLRTWNTSDQSYKQLDNVQNIVHKNVTVYFSTGLDTPLLVSLSKKDGSFDYYYTIKQGGLTYWNHLDVSNYQKLLSETIEKVDKIHEKLTESDCEKLLKLLKQIEASILNAVLVLLSEKTTYNNKEVERRLRWSHRVPRNIKDISDSQPDSITVERQNYPNLTSEKFECYLQTIKPKGQFKADLRIMVPSYDEYSNVLFINPEPDVNYRSKIIFDLDQRGHRTYYDAEKYYVNVQKKEFTNPPYIRYAHTCVSCGKLSEGEFTIKFDNIGVNFSNDIPETEQKRFDVYFHKSYPEKFSTVVFHQPGSNKPRYFGYSNFVEYHKNNKVIKLSSLSEFNHKYEDNINTEFKKVLDVEYPNLQKIYRLDTVDIFYKENQTALYVYFQSSYVAPMMFCYDDKAYIPRNRANYYGEWVQVREIKSCKYEGENEQKILNTISYIYMSLNTDDRKIIRDRWDYNGNDDAIKTLPDNLSILTLTNAQVTISTIHNDKIKKHNRIQRLEVDLYYFNNDSTYVEFSGDIYTKLTINTKSNYGIDIIKFYYITILTLKNGSYVHRIEYIRDTPTDEVTIHLHTNTLFVYSYVRKYDDWYKPFHFIGITRIKPFNHSNEVDKYFEKIRALNRKNFFITRIFKLS